jgi:exodeoxyribonuclease V beta subunit
LKQFLKTEGPLFEDNLIRETAVTGYHSPAAGKVFTPRPNPGIEIKNTFGIHSFSGLSKAHHSALFEIADLNEKDIYDQFIFQDLGRGASVGTALHSIFERLNFAEPETWEQTLKDASKYYSTIIKEESLDHFMQLVNHLMTTEIVCEGEKFALNRIKSAQKLPEMQFYFSMDSVNKTEINKILGEEADLEGEADIEGLMTGFIDLLFEYNGKYYILDWKSNQLGNSTENYNTAGMEEAMKGSNYNLQFMIYTVAVKRWLEKRVENFNYEKQFGGIIYVFLRGVREGSETGIFKTKPQADKIESLEKLLSHK